MTLLIEASVIDRTEQPKDSILNEKEMEILERFIRTGIPEYIKLSGAFSNEWLQMHRIMTANENKYALKTAKSGTGSEESDLEQRPSLIIWLQNLHKKFEHLPLPSTIFESDAEREYGIKPRKEKPRLGTDGKKYDVRPSTILDTTRDYLAMTEREEPWKETTGERVLKKHDKTIDNIKYFTGKVEGNKGYAEDIKNSLGDLKKITEGLSQIRVVGSIYEHLNEPMKFPDTVTQAQYDGILDNLETKVSRLVIAPDGLDKGQTELWVEINILYQELRSFNKDNTKQKDDRLNELNVEIKNLYITSKRYQTFITNAISRYGRRWGEDQSENIRVKLKGLDGAIGKFGELIKEHKKEDKILELTKNDLHKTFVAALEDLKTALHWSFQGEQENFFDAEYKEFKDLFGDNLLGAEELKNAFSGLETHSFIRYKHGLTQDIESAESFVANTNEARAEGWGDWKEIPEKRFGLQLEISDQDERLIKEKLFDFCMEPDVYDFVQQVKNGLADPKNWALFAVAPQRNFKWDISDDKKRELATRNKSCRDGGAVYHTHRAEAFYVNNFINSTQQSKGSFQWRLMPTKPTRHCIPEGKFATAEQPGGQLLVEESIKDEPREAEFLDQKQRRIADILEVQQFEFMRIKQEGHNPLENYAVEDVWRGAKFDDKKDRPVFVASNNGVKPGQLSHYVDRIYVDKDYRKNMLHSRSGIIKQQDYLTAVKYDFLPSLYSQDISNWQSNYMGSIILGQKFKSLLKNFPAVGYNIR